MLKKRPRYLWPFLLDEVIRIDDLADNDRDFVSTAVTVADIFASFKHIRAIEVEINKYISVMGSRRIRDHDRRRARIETVVIEPHGRELRYGFESDR